MKKRWIEITRFRRRRTIVLRDSSALGIAANPHTHPDPDTGALVHSDAAPFMKIDLDQVEVTDSAAPGRFRSNKDRIAKDRKLT